MSNFEHIDEYLTNRLNPEQKAGFEKQLESDGALRADVEFQKLTIEAIKNARAAQLKSMLNQVPVGGSVSGGMTAAKIAGGVISAALIASLTYFYLHQDPSTAAQKPVDVRSEIAPAPETEVKQPLVYADSVKGEDAINAVTTEEGGPSVLAKSAIKKESKKNQEQPVSPVRDTKMEVLDLSDEQNSSNVKSNTPLIDNRKPEIAPSRIEVSTDSSNKKYSFHYQFSNGKLLLYGSFDKGLYEILEISGTGHNVFLFYQTNYYLLEEKDNTTRPLEPVKDPVLLKRLREYRTR